MKIEVVLFAHVREAFGADSVEVEVSDTATVADVIDVLAARPQWHSVAMLPLSYAVNDVYANDKQLLRPGDRVAVLPPMSGG